ncbi:MAG: GNAT family N-acetyltransferase [Acidimicrobiia bacterium]
MDIELRPIVADELPAYERADEYGFGLRYEKDDDRHHWSGLELERTVAAFQGDEIVAAGRNYSLELTLPGGAVIPASGVSWISVRPTHRRRGILSRMMAYLAEESARRGDPVSMLTASEGGIYGRFGYGVATRVLAIEMHRSAVAFAAPVQQGRVRMVEPEENLKVAPELFDRVRVQRNGAVSRPSAWWLDAWGQKEFVKQRFDVVYEVDGRVEGYAVYGIEGRWQNGFSDQTVGVHDLVAVTPDAEAALWQHLCSIDLTNRVTHWVVAPDTELPWRLADVRQMRTVALRDWLWLRPVDVAALLSARTYATAERLVLDVRDGRRPDGAASGRFLLEGGPDGATCVRTDADPDLVLGVGALGSISLGGVPASLLARAGAVDEQVPGTLRVADRMFAAERAPFAFTWF